MKISSLGWSCWAAGCLYFGYGLIRNKHVHLHACTYRTYFVRVYVLMSAQPVCGKTDARCLQARFHDFEKDLPSLEGKVVCVTGCTTGTGFIAARTAKGWHALATCQVLLMTWFSRCRFRERRCIFKTRFHAYSFFGSPILVSAPSCGAFPGQLPRKEPMWSC